MPDYTLVKPEGWTIDLHALYAAYMGHFQYHALPWYDRSWAAFFETFEQFLSFSWPVITVTDKHTGRAHIVTRPSSHDAFLRMIKTNFGTTLPTPDNIHPIAPAETSARPMRTVSDLASYKRLHGALPAVRFSALRARVRACDRVAINALWDAKDKIFLALDFECNERNRGMLLEWGYAVVRCGALSGRGVWPPDPSVNYRSGHYIVAEYADKQVNVECPTHPWEFAFGESLVVPKAKLPMIIQSVLSSLVSPDSDIEPNTLVLVGHNIAGDLKRLAELRISIPNNVLSIDTAVLARPQTRSAPRPSLHDLLLLLNLPVPCALHNAGNDAALSLFLLQHLLDPKNTPALTPRSKRRNGNTGNRQSIMVERKRKSGAPETPPRVQVVGRAGEFPPMPEGERAHAMATAMGYPLAGDERRLSMGVMGLRPVSTGSMGPLLSPAPLGMGLSRSTGALGVPGSLGPPPLTRPLSAGYPSRPLSAAYTPRPSRPLSAGPNAMLQEWAGGSAKRDSVRMDEATRRLSAISLGGMGHTWAGQ